MHEYFGLISSNPDLSAATAKKTYFDDFEIG